MPVPCSNSACVKLVTAVESPNLARFTACDAFQVWIYEEAGTSEDSNIYVHHDIMLPAFPLSLAWMDCRPTGDAQSGNLAAVGTMSPGIEIW